MKLIETWGMLKELDLAQIHMGSIQALLKKILELQIYPNIWQGR